MSISIKILGPGCPKCLQTERLVKKVIAENGVEADVTKVDDIMEIINYNVLSTPAVVVNEEVRISGKVPSEKEILDLFN